MCHRCLQALWLANMSSVILFWPYLKASFMTPVKQLLGRTMEFKTTLKGAGAGAFSFKVYGMPIIIIIVNVASFLIGVITLDTQINAAKVRCSPRPPLLSPRCRAPMLPVATPAACLLYCLLASSEPPCHTCHGST